MRWALLPAVLASITAFPAVAHADTPPPIKLAFTAYDSMTIRDCLRVMSMETGQIVLPDASVNGFVGAINATEPDVPSMLDYLKTFEPGLTYQIVYYPNSNYEPDGEDLYQQIQELRALTIDGVVLPPYGDDNTMLSLQVERYVSPDAAKKAEAGMVPFYLVSDTTVRAQMKRPSDQAGTTTTQLISTFQTSLNALLSKIPQMSSQDKQSALAAIVGAEKQMGQVTAH